MLLFLCFYICLTIMEMNMNIWGPYYWFVIHTIAMTYPKVPGATTKKRYYQFFKELPHFLPHPKAKKLFNHILNKYPITPYLDSKESLLKWCHFIHNKINIILHKQTMTYKEFYETYHAQYIPKPIKNDTSKEWKQKLAYGCFLIIIMISIIFFTR